MTREQWLEHAADLVWNNLFGSLGLDRQKWAVSVGWPHKSAMAKKNRRIGECWSRDLSERHVFEIFISPVLDDPVEVMAVLAHEMVHATCGLACGHKGPFRKLALIIGLEGRMTATKPGEELTAKLQEIARTVGDYPHGRLDKKRMAELEKKQRTRYVKCECPGCGCILRMVQKWIEKGMPTCSCGEEFEPDGEQLKLLGA